MNLKTAYISPAQTCSLNRIKPKELQLKDTILLLLLLLLYIIRWL